MTTQIVMGHHKILEAINAAATELARLEQRALQLRSFIEAGKALLDEVESTKVLPQAIEETEAVAPQLSGPQLDMKEDDEGAQAYKAADWARKALKEVGRPMRVPEIAQVLADRHWGAPEYAHEVIRTAMGRHEDFERIAFGVYALKEWPASMKRQLHKNSRGLLPRRRPAGTSKESWPQLIYAILKDTGSPRTIDQILQLLKGKGYKVNKESARRAVYRCIEQDRLFILVSPGLFGLREWRNHQKENQPAPARMEETPSIENQTMEELQHGELSEAENALSYQSA